MQYLYTLIIIQEENRVLNDGSGLGFYKATCKDSVVAPDVWPQCIPFVSISQFLCPRSIQIRFKNISKKFFSLLISP